MWGWDISRGSCGRLCIESSSSWERVRKGRMERTEEMIGEVRQEKRSDIHYTLLAVQMPAPDNSV